LRYLPVQTRCDALREGKISVWAFCVFWGWLLSV